MIDEVKAGAKKVVRVKVKCRTEQSSKRGDNLQYQKRRFPKREQRAPKEC